MGQQFYPYELKLDSSTVFKLKTSSGNNFNLLLRQAPVLLPVNRRRGKTVYAAMHKKIRVDLTHVKAV